MIRNTALVLGATGLVGSELLQLLLDDDGYSRIIVLARRLPIHQIESKKLHWHLVDFDQTLDKKLLKADHVFCCLGTTMKKAGSKSAFEQQDLFLPLKIANDIAEHKPEKFLVVTALTANHNPPIFHLRLKYQLEEGLKRIFQNLSTELIAVRPSLIMGDREDLRLAEKIGSLVFGLPSRLLLHGSLANAAGIYGAEVALALHEIAKDCAVTAHIEFERIC